MTEARHGTASLATVIDVFDLHDVMIGVSGGLKNGTVERIIRVDARGAMT